MNKSLPNKRKAPECLSEGFPNLRRTVQRRTEAYGTRRFNRVRQSYRPRLRTGHSSLEEQLPRVAMTTHGNAGCLKKSGGLVKGSLCFRPSKPLTGFTHHLDSKLGENGKPDGLASLPTLPYPAHLTQNVDLRQEAEVDLVVVSVFDLPGLVG